MQRGTRFVPLTIVTLAVLCGWLCAAPVAAQIADEAKAKIDIALPAAPIAEPQRERKLLVFSLSNGFQHSAIPYGDYTFARMGEKSGAFTATISTDPQAFAPASLAEYDAILFNNTTGTLFTDPVLRESLINFVHGGGGIVGIHAATDCFYDWPQFGELMGGYFDGHPWNEAVTLKIDEPDHPVAQPLGEEFTVADEIYQFKQPYSRENLRVLASLDTTKTDMSKKGIARDDGDFAVSWVRDYGQGRIFYCSLGHRHEIFWNEAVLRHYLAGIQFALGDLQAEAEPSRTGAAIEGDLAQAFAEAAEYEFGDSRLPLTAIENAVFAAVDSPAERRSLEARLIDLLKDEVSYDVQAFVCRELSLVGGEASAEAVAPLLVDERLSHMARYTLERLDTPAADEVLRNALERLDGQLRIGVINSLGQRGRRGAVAPLLALAQDSETDDATRAAVAEAIGRLGGMEGNDALVNLANLGRQTQSGELLEACYLAMAQCAESLVEEGKLEQAAGVDVGERVGLGQAHRAHVPLRQRIHRVERGLPRHRVTLAGSEVDLDFVGTRVQLGDHSLAPPRPVVHGTAGQERRATVERDEARPVDPALRDSCLGSKVVEPRLAAERAPQVLLALLLDARHVVEAELRERRQRAQDVAAALALVERFDQHAAEHAGALLLPLLDQRVHRAEVARELSWLRHFLEPEPFERFEITSTGNFVERQSCLRHRGQCRAAGVASCVGAVAVSEAWIIRQAARRGFRPRTEARSRRTRLGERDRARGPAQRGSRRTRFRRVGGTLASCRRAAHPTRPGPR